MSNIFEITGKKGKKIKLTGECWKHINQGHPDIGDINEIELTLTLPTKITPSIYDSENVEWYYRYNKTKRKYLFVAVKYLNGEGFVITSFYVRNIK